MERLGLQSIRDSERDPYPSWWGGAEGLPGGVTGSPTGKEGGAIALHSKLSGTQRDLLYRTQGGGSTGLAESGVTVSLWGPAAL